MTTSSITQGEVVAPLFDPILRAGWKIKFGHRTFRWTSEASGAAVVHCVIIGFARHLDRRRLFDYATPDAKPIERASITNITPYLTDGPTVIVRPATRPLNRQLGEVAYGNKPTDDGRLIVESSDYDKVMADRIAAKYVRPFVGARELLHGGDRYCLWLVDAPPSDLRNSPVLRERIEGVRAFRAASKAASTRQAAATAHLFRQIAQLSTPYLCIPAHVSETRPYFVVARFDQNVISSNANFISPDPDGFIFAIISSTMFLTWQKTVGGRLESRLRFNKLLTWNTFPLPPTDQTARDRVIAAGAAVAQARAQHPDLALADLYSPDRIPVDLLDAHESLDHEVDTLFRMTRSARSELDRQDVLFAGYQLIAEPLLAPAAATRPRRGR